MDQIGTYKSMVRSRAFEEELEKLSSQALLYGTYHLAIGQEALSTGLAAAIASDDWIVPTHRCHGYNAATGSDLEKMFSEILGSRHGLCKGLGGSMHMTDVEHGNLGSSAVVGSGIGLAGGVALALKMMGKDSIAVAIFGDGASSRGILYEVMNAASLWHLPLLFLLENNHYGMSAASERMIAADGIYKRAETFLIPSISIDGNDVMAVYDAVSMARERIIRDKKPFFIEADTYRQCGHSRSDKLLYRTREEENAWKERDPIMLYSTFLRLTGVDGETLDEARNSVIDEVGLALSSALSHKDDKLTEREMENLIEVPSPLIEDGSKKTHKGTYREAIREALDEILQDDGKAYLMGEDIGRYGGCFGVTQGLVDKYPDRLIETPVSEEGFVSMATGSAMMGMHPIVEVMYGDFSTLASDPLINHAAKARFMSGGQLSCPIVFRTPIGGMTGHGPQHTQCLETMFLSIPGLKVVAPSEPYSAKALLKAAAKDGNPVLFFEHKALYGNDGDIGDGNSFLPLGKAITKRLGDELLVIGYSRAFSQAFEALSDQPFTFIDLATIHPLDEETIASEYERIGRALIVEDTPLQGSVAESVMRIIASCPSYKPGSVKIVHSLDLPLPCPRELESIVLPTASQIREAALTE